MALNNPLNGNMISQEPHFHGDREKAGLSALEFITRLDNLFRSVGDSPEERRAFGARAVNMLHGKAHNWFHNALTFNRELAQIEAQTSWPVLKELMQEEYDIITESADVSTNWGSLRQMERETATEFHTRISGVMSEYMRVAPTINAPTNQDPIMAGLLNIRERHLDTVEGNLPRQVLINEYQAIWLTFMRETAARVRRQMLQDLATKTLAEGLLGTEYRELVRQAERERVPFMDIASKLRNKQKAIANKKAHKQASTSSKISNSPSGATQHGTQHGTFQDQSSEEEEEQHTAAVKQKKSTKPFKKFQKKGRNKNTAAGLQDEQKSSSPMSATSATKCDFCGGPFHVEKDCRSKEYHKRQANKYRLDQYRDKQSAVASGINYNFREQFHNPARTNTVYSNKQQAENCRADL